MTSLGGRSRIPRLAAPTAVRARHPAGQVGGGCTPSTETFDKADGALGPDMTWTSPTVWLQAYVRGNQFARNTSATDGLTCASTDAGADNISAEVTLSTYSGTTAKIQAGLWLRAPNTDLGSNFQGYELQMHATSWVLTIGHGGATLASGSWTLAAGDTFGVTTIGDVVTATHNGAQIAAVSDATYAAGTRVALIIGNGVAFGGGETLDARFDNLSICTFA